MSTSATFTQQLDRWQSGDPNAFAQVTELIYQELHRLACKEMAKERKGHTLQATALVNEAFLRLADANLSCADRRHFFSLAARTLRRILVDHARHNARQKRGENGQRLTLHESMLANAAPQMDVLELDDALSQLASQDHRKAEIIELQFFAGMTNEEIAELLGLSSKTIERDSKFARAWLHRFLSQ